MSSTHTFRVGDTVLFGRTHGEKTLGKVVGINAKSVKVEQTEERGSRPVGTVWRVASSLVYALEERPSSSALATPPMPRKAKPSVRLGQRVAFTTKDGTDAGTVVGIYRIVGGGDFPQVYKVETDSGWTGTRNMRGRCEDATRCECCTF